MVHTSGWTFEFLGGGWGGRFGQYKIFFTTDKQRQLFFLSRKAVHDIEFLILVHVLQEHIFKSFTPPKKSFNGLSFIQIRSQ